MERADFRFSRRDVRAWARWGDTQLKKHLHRLEELEYLLVHRGGRGQSFVYELLFDGHGERRQAVASGPDRRGRLKYDEKKSPLEEEKSRLKSPPSRGGVAGWSPLRNPHQYRRKWRFCAKTAKTALIPASEEEEVVIVAAGAVEMIEHKPRTGGRKKRPVPAEPPDPLQACHRPVSRLDRRA